MISLLLRKLVRRMEWTWLTFPLAVVLVSVAAYALACGLKGGRIRVHQADLVDVNAASGRIRGATWLNLFSPRTEAFDLSVEPQRPDAKGPAGGPLPGARSWMGWLGLTGTGLGGMDAKSQATLFGGARSITRRTMRARRSADPSLVNQELHRPLGRSRDRLSGRRSVGNGATADRPDHQHAAFSPARLHRGPRRIGLRDRHAAARRIGPAWTDGPAERAEDAADRADGARRRPEVPPGIDAL